MISVYVNSNVSNASFEIEYIFRSASWCPEIRVNNLKQLAKLHLKAQVVQDTGIDWNDVKLSLSSSQIFKLLNYAKGKYTINEGT